MIKLSTAIVSSAAALLFAGNAFAAPAAGEFPLFQDAPVAVSSVERAHVVVDASRQMPAAGEMSAQSEIASDSGVSRAEVRQETLDAFAKGFRPAIGNRG